MPHPRRTATGRKISGNDDIRGRASSKTLRRRSRKTRVKDKRISSRQLAPRFPLKPCFCTGFARTSSKIIFKINRFRLPGPSTWASKFPSAGGSRQSPVDIDTKKARSDTKAKPLRTKYAPDKVLTLVNPGYGWKVEVDGEGSELGGGPLEGSYRLEQFHCHWGCTNEKGSEHTVDGKSYAGELHLVHWNSTKYGSFCEAASNPDGLAVLGIFLQVGSEHEELGKVASLLPQISFRGDSIPFPGEMNPAKLLPRERSYWTYQGSLTTPPCTESVTWLVFKEPIQVSENQLNLFRNLRCRRKDDACANDDGLIINNFRPPLPLGNRELRECGSV